MVRYGPQLLGKKNRVEAAPPVEVRIPCRHPACKLTFRTERLRDLHVERFHRHLVEGENEFY